MQSFYTQYRNRIRNILIIKLRAIGDVILATPVIENLRLAFPEAHITFLTEKPAAPIVSGNPFLNQALIFNRTAIERQSAMEGLRETWRFFQCLRRNRYDLVIDLFGNPRSAQFTWFSKAPFRVGFDFRVRRFAYNIRVPARGDQIHEVLFNLEALEYLGIPVVTHSLYIPVTAEHEHFAAQFWQKAGLQGRRVIALGVSGGWYTKRWPLEKFAHLADRLIQELQARVLLLWGPGEWNDVQKVRALMKEEPILAPETSLLQLAALLKRVTLLVSNDSGPMHLAAAVGTRVVALYGPTRPELQGPWGDTHRVVRLASLPCLGCNATRCSIKTHDCMQKLDVEQVFDEVLGAVHG